MIRCLLAALLFIAAAAQAQSAPYALEGTEVRPLRATQLQRAYELFIALPPSYAAQPQRRYPVVFVTDANYAFPVARAIGRRISDHGKALEDFILVGLSYAKGDTPEYSRRRDYTPAAPTERDARSDMPGRAPAFGEAEGYRRFLLQEVFPFVERHYRADMSRRVFAGHSYGALFGLHVLFTEPTMFQHYILGSPSIWFASGTMFAREREYAAGHRELKAKVFLGIGSFETVKPGSDNPRYHRQNDMVRDLRAMERALRARRYPGLELHARVIVDEDHFTVAPAILTRGLMWALGTPPRRP